MSGKDSPTFSIEFFPPRTEAGRPKLDAVHRELAALHPDFFSVTYGAGGSTKEGTSELVLKYQAMGSSVAPHLSFGGTSEEEVRRLLAGYAEAGIQRIVALRGDIPTESGKQQYRYASELVSFIRAESGDRFHIEVACYPECHPQSPDFESDVHYFREKVNAGANSAITQYFFNADAYFRFVEYCQGKGIDIPIVAGIMPIYNYANLTRFSEKCGAEIPRWLDKRLQDFQDDPEGLKSFGIDVVSSLCETLLDNGVPGLHFYSLNLSRAVIEIWNNLSLSDRR
ncbi:MAG: methylenetetrahydrofolate reductase [NAD(P)H] [Gammaproteobacteria bacterium]